MRTLILIASAIVLFVLSAKAHGRELRLERQRLGVAQVVFGGTNPPVVEALWRAERVRFAKVVLALVAMLSALLIARFGMSGLVALGALSWAPALGFTLLGLWSLLRAGALDRPELVGSAGWWTLVAAAFASNLLLAQRQWMT